MARYTLKTFYGSRQLERFEHRSPEKLRSILSHPRFQLAGPDVSGVEEVHPTRVEIVDSLMYKLFEGNVEDALNFTRTMR